MLPTTGGRIGGGGAGIGISSMWQGNSIMMGSGSGSGSSGSGSGSGGMKAMRMRGKRVWMYLRRLGRIGQMDFEVALWQILWLLVSPKRVYRSVYYHKQTKNQWARDDPAFLLVIALSLTIAAVAYSLAFGSSVLATFRLILSFICLDFILPGLIVATLAWYSSILQLFYSSILQFFNILFL
jgi:hypothetical protein